jgi:hypothetical protein
VQRARGLERTASKSRSVPAIGGFGSERRAQGTLAQARGVLGGARYKGGEINRRLGPSDGHHRLCNTLGPFRRGRFSFANCSVALGSSSGSVHCIKYSYPDQCDESERHKRGQRHRLYRSQVLFSAPLCRTHWVSGPMTSATAPAACPLSGVKRTSKLVPRMRVIGTAGTAEPPPLGVKVANIWQPYADLCEALSRSRRPSHPLQLAK